MLRGVVYRLIEYLAFMGHSSIWELIYAICVCNILTVGVHLSSTPSISGHGSAPGHIPLELGILARKRLKLRALSVVSYIVKS